MVVLESLKAYFEIDEIQESIVKTTCTRQLLTYGIDAIIHNHVLTNNRSIVSEDKTGGILYVRFTDFKRETGIYVPGAADKLRGSHLSGDHNIRLFSPEYKALMPYGFDDLLTRTGWKISDLDDEELIRRGINFSSLLFNQVMSSCSAHMSINDDNTLVRSDLHTNLYGLMAYYMALFELKKVA